MKAFLGICLLASTACSDSQSGTHLQSYSFGEADKSAILQLLDEESRSFYSRNFEQWKMMFSPDTVVWTCVEENGLVLEAYNKADLQTLVNEYMVENPQPDSVLVTRENIVFIPGSDMVWVSFDEYQTLAGKTRILKGVRMVTRKGKGWEIRALHSSFVNYR